jgi:ABC-type glycerol-3-phosphate transport system substrate-binding protein
METFLAQQLMYKGVCMYTLKRLLLFVLVLTMVVGCGTPAAPSSNNSGIAPSASPPAAPAASNSSASAAASTASQAASGEVVEVTFAMNAIANEIPGWTAAVEAANKQLASKNIRIKVQNVPAAGWAEYYQKNVAQIAAGRPADIGRIAESLMPVVIDKGQVVDLTNYASQLDKSQYFQKTFQNSAVKDGRTYGVPSGVYYMVLYYNKDLFDKAGIAYPSSDWNNPSSFEEVRDMAKKLTQGEGAHKTFGLSAGPYIAFMGMYSKANGGQNVFTADGTCALTTPASLAVYQWFDGMLRNDRSLPRPTDTKVVPPLEMFKAGRLGMMIDGTWSLAALKDIKNFKVGVAAIPAGDGQPGYSSQFVDSWVIWKGSKHEQESWEAIKALVSAEATLAVAEKGVGGTPVHKTAAERWQEQVLGTSFSAEDKTTLTNGLEHTLAVPYTPQYQEIDDKANASMDEWLLGNSSSEQYATKVCDIINTTQQQ